MKKKVLVVDDDSFARTRMKGFLRSFPCTVLEAEDGVQALALIATESPDLVLLDVNMPVLDGLQTLREIRSSTTHSRLPVVSVSTHAERAMVMRLIDLGIAGFLVKPLKPDDTMKRLEALFRSPKNAFESGETAAAGQRLLLVDHDPNFREFVRSLLDNHFEILEAATSAVGLQLFREHEPRVVCMSDNLQLLGTRLLVRMIRETRSRFPPRLYLLAETEEVADPQRLLFDGVLHKSFAPDVFDRELRGTLLAGESASGTIASLVRGRLRAELVTAIRQSIGVLSSQDAFVLDSGEVKERPYPVQARAELVARNPDVTVRVGLLTAEEDAVRIGSKIVGAPVTLERGAADAVAELVNTIAGRLCTLLAACGFRLEQSAPSISVRAALSESPAREVTVSLQTEDGERFRIDVRVLDGIVREPSTFSERVA